MKTTVISDEVRELATRIFAERMATAGPMTDRPVERLATDIIRKARAFCSAMEKAESGALDVAEPTGVQLADYCAPNLPPTSPFNLVSSRFGDLAFVQKVAAWLEKNTEPPYESDLKLAAWRKSLVEKANAEFKFHNRDNGAQWTMADINAARQIFPAYCE